MILYGTKKILKINTNLIRIYLGSLVGSLSTFLLFIKISNLNLFLSKIIISTIMILISFKKNNFLRNIFYFYIISIILGGFIYLIDLNSNYYIQLTLIVIIAPIIIYILTKEIKKYKEIIKNKYFVEIKYKNKTYKLEGFIDTGNRLISPIKKESVILVNLKINSKELIYVPYKALNTSGIIPCIKPDKVIVEDKEISNCLVGLAKDKFKINGLNCILPNKLKEELC
jgi:stage II sporulation protein GA (sporulation sigma-E factor processing peptidase)